MYFGEWKLITVIRSWEDDNQRLEPELSFEIELEKYSQDRINKNKPKKEE